MTHTKGNIIVEEIKVGDIHYEFECGLCVKSKVLTLPVHNKETSCFEWQSENMNTGKIINYAVNPKYSHYGPNLYDYEAYYNCKYI